MLKIDGHPHVYDELEDSRSWYDEQQGVRRFLVHRFPYAIIYKPTSSLIQIIAVMHLRRHPDYWKSITTYWPSG